MAKRRKKSPSSLDKIRKHLTEEDFVVHGIADLPTFLDETMRGADKSDRRAVLFIVAELIIAADEAKRKRLAEARLEPFYRNAVRIAERRLDGEITHARTLRQIPETCPCARRVSSEDRDVPTPETVSRRKTLTDAVFSVTRQSFSPMEKRIIALINCGRTVHEVAEIFGQVSNETRILAISFEIIRRHERGHQWLALTDDDEMIRDMILSGGTAEQIIDQLRAHSDPLRVRQTAKSALRKMNLTLNGPPRRIRKRAGRKK